MVQANTPTKAAARKSRATKASSRQTTKASSAGSTRSMSVERQASPGRGRQEGRTIRQYLEALQASPAQARTKERRRKHPAPPAADRLRPTPRRRPEPDPASAGADGPPVGVSSPVRIRSTWRRWRKNSSRQPAPTRSGRESPTAPGARSACRLPCWRSWHRPDPQSGLTPAPDWPAAASGPDGRPGV